MEVTLWGTRGSLATPGPETGRYGGNTSCVGVVGREGTMLVLDAGTGIRRLAAADAAGAVLTYLPDHEPALGTLRFPCLPRGWTSGAALAAEADLLIHDSQYSEVEYPGHCGWGHSSLDQTLDFGTLVEVRQLVTFHHDPAHTDSALDQLMAEATARTKPAYRVTPGIEGTTFAL